MFAPLREYLSKERVTAGRSTMDEEEEAWVESSAQGPFRGGVGETKSQSTKGRLPSVTVKTILAVSRDSDGNPGALLPEGAREETYWAGGGYGGCG
jgi:hypothetical protein